MAAATQSITPANDPAHVPADVCDLTIAKAARYTLLSMTEHRSIGQLALRYEHEGRSDTKEIAYATASKCVYGPLFAQMDRFSQTFVVAHETLHHVLGHIPRGAILYKREKSRFSFLVWNIACDAGINWILDNLPDVDKLSDGIRYGVRKCQELGIVNWASIQEEVRKLLETGRAHPNPVFDVTPAELKAEDIYHALMAIIRQVADDQQRQSHSSDGSSASDQNKSADKSSPSSSQGGDDLADDASDDASSTQSTEDDLIENLARSLNAHDDLKDAILEAAERSEHDLRDNVLRAEDTLRRVQAGAGSRDAILKASRPDGATQTPWPQAMRHMATSALIHRPTIDPSRPSRRVVSQIAMARDPKTPSAMKPRGIVFEPRLSSRTPAKKCFLVIDTSASMLCDKDLLRDCLREAQSICKRVDTSLTVIFADAKVCEVVAIDDAYDKIKALVPKGGGGTDFRPAIALAEKHRPDLIIYLTDLMGSFPEKKPRAPIIWGFPPAYAQIQTPYGKRMPLMA